MNLHCPFCQTQIIKAAQFTPCPTCEYVDIVASVEGDLDSYYIKTIYRGLTYWACFEDVNYDPTFIIKYWDKNERLRTLLTLPYFPNITPDNFSDKLKTILTFQ
jgi:hypothetical protein